MTYMTSRKVLGRFDHLRYGQIDGLQLFVMNLEFLFLNYLLSSLLNYPKIYISL
jgi:hypothetical protein